MTIGKISELSMAEKDELFKTGMCQNCGTPELFERTVYGWECWACEEVFAEVIECQ